MSKESWREWEREPKKFLQANYPFKESWVKKNIDVLTGFRERNNFRSDRIIVEDAINLTIGFARQSGIDIRPNETDVIHIPSRLEAIRRVEKDVEPLFKQLTLDRIVRIFIVAEAASVQESIGYASSDVAQNHLIKLNELVRIHKDLTGGR
jgi:hypothetical protein